MTCRTSKMLRSHPLLQKKKKKKIISQQKGVDCLNDCTQKISNDRVFFFYLGSVEKFLLDVTLKEFWGAPSGSPFKKFLNHGVYSIFLQSVRHEKITRQILFSHRSFFFFS